MITLNNCKLASGDITLTLKSGISKFHVRGYAIAKEDGTIVLQPTDLRRNPVLVCPAESVASIIVNL